MIVNDKETKILFSHKK